MVGSVNTERQNVDECPVAVSKREGMRMGGRREEEGKSSGRERKGEGIKRGAGGTTCVIQWNLCTVVTLRQGFIFGGGQSLAPPWKSQVAIFFQRVIGRNGYGTETQHKEYTA